MSEDLPHVGPGKKLVLGFTKPEIRQATPLKQNPLAGSTDAGEGERSKKARRVSAVTACEFHFTLGGGTKKKDGSEVSLQFQEE